MAVDDHEHLRAAYRRKKEQDAPAPWRRIQLYINGLVAVGFGPDTDLLLCHSHSGFGVVDCATGQVIARDYEDRELPMILIPCGRRGLVRSPASAFPSRVCGVAGCDR